MFINDLTKVVIVCVFCCVICLFFFFNQEMNVFIYYHQIKFRFVLRTCCLSIIILIILDLLEPISWSAH